MKKIIICILCAALICLMPLTVYATDGEQTEVSSEVVVEYVKTHIEEISVIITMIVTAFYNITKNKRLDRSVSVLNNNAVTVATESKAAIDGALTSVTEAAACVNEYKNEMAYLLAEVRANEDEKQELQRKLAQVTSYLQRSKDANVEFASELAELMMLANIPNAKKDELYSRHLAAVRALEEVGGKDEAA